MRLTYNMDIKATLDHLVRVNMNPQKMKARLGTGFIDLLRERKSIMREKVERESGERIFVSFKSGNHDRDHQRLYQGDSIWINHD